MTLRRIARWILLLAGGLLVLAVGLWLLRVPLFGGLVKREIVSALRGATGGRYTIESVGGNWITELCIRGLRTVEAPPDGVLTALDADEIVLRYRPLELLGDDPVAALRAVAVDGLRVAVEPARAGSTDRGEAPSLELPASLRPDIRIAGSLRVAFGEDTVLLEGIHLAVGPDRPLSIQVASVDAPDRYDVDGPFTGRVERVGEGRWRWTSDAELGGVRVPQVDVTSVQDIRGRLEVAGGTIGIVVAGEAATATLGGIDLARLPAWMRNLALGGAWPTAGRLDGEVGVRFDGGLAFERMPPLTFELTVGDALIQGEWFQEATATGRWDGGRVVSLLSFRAIANGLLVQGDGVELDLERPWLLQRASRIELTLDDARRYARHLDREVRVEIRAHATAPDRLDVDEVLLQSRGDALALRGVVDLPGETGAWRDAQLDLALDGRLADPSPLDLRWEGALELEGTVRGRLVNPDVVLGATGRGARIETYAIDRLRVEGRVAAEGIDRMVLDVVGADGHVRGAGLLQWAPLDLDLTSVNVVAGDVAPLVDRFLPDAPRVAGRLSGEGAFRWSRDGAWRASGGVTVEDLVMDGDPVGRLAIRLASNAQGVTVDAVEAEGPWGHLQAAGLVRPEQGEATVDGLRLEAQGMVATLRHALDVSWRDGRVLAHGVDLAWDDRRVEADLEFDAAAQRVSVSRLRVTDAALDLRALAWIDLRSERMEFQRLEVRGDFGEARLRAPLVLMRRGDVVDVPDLRAEVAGMGVEGALQADLGTRRVQVRALRVRRDELDVVLAAPAHVTWDEAGISVAGLDARMLGARVTGRASWADALVADLEVEGFALDRLVDGIQGEARGRVHVRGDTLEAVLEVPSARIEEWTGSARLAVRQARGGTLVVERLEVRGPQGGALVGNARLPYRLEGLHLARVEGARPELVLDGSIGGVRGFVDAADGPLHVRVRGASGVLDAVVRLDDFALCDATSACDDAVLDLHLDPTSATLTVALASDEFADVRGSFRLDRGLDWTRPGDLAAFVRAAQVEGSLRAVVRSWKPLAALVPGVNRLEGGAGIDLRLSGPLRRPRLEGGLTLSGFTLALDGDVAPFESVDARLVWEGDRMRIERLEGLMGYAPFAIGGEVRLPSTGMPEFDLTIHGRNTQLLRTDWTRMRIDVDGTIRGPLDALVAKGEGRIVEATFSEPVSLSGVGGVSDKSELVLFEIEDWPFSAMRFDLDVKADRSLRVRNNFLRVNVSFEGRLQGTGLRPEPVGRAWFENADVFLPLTTLRGGEGDVTFPSGSPFRPRIQMTAGSRTRGYELGVQIAGALPDVNLYVFTEPRLDDEDAILMLTTGSTAAELAQGGLVGKALSAVINVFGGSLLTTRNADGEPGRKAFFERFEFTTDWDGRSITTIDGEVELTDRFYLHLQTDRFESSNLGLIWRIRFR